MMRIPAKTVTVVVSAYNDGSALCFRVVGPRGEDMRVGEPGWNSVAWVEQAVGREVHAALDTLCEDARKAARTAEEVMLDQDIDNVEGFTIRVLNSLASAKIETVRDLVQHSAADLLRIRSFGRLSLENVETTLDAYGLQLKEHKAP